MKTQTKKYSIATYNLETTVGLSGLVGSHGLESQIS